MARPIAFPIKKIIGFDEEMLARVDAWRAKQHPLPNQSEAIRQLLDKALAAERPPSTSDEQVARAKRKIAANPIPKQPSPEGGMAMLRRGKAELQLRGFAGKKGGTVKARKQ